MLSDWTRRVVQAATLFLFAVLWSAAAFGSNRASENLTPTFIYVIFWVGMVLVCIVLGNVWSVLNPWRAAADLVAWVARKVGWNRETRPYPERLGLWPAIFLLGGFTVLELVWKDPANPRTLAQAIAVYSVATWTGMFLYGRKPWLQNGDGFSVYFGFLSRAALFGTRQQDGGSTEVILRKPFSGLAHVERRAGAVGFFALMLGQVAFDGLSRSSWWFERIYDVETSFSSPDTAENAVMAFNLAGMILMILFVALVYTVAIRIAEGVVGEGSRLPRDLPLQSRADRDRLCALALPLAASDPGTVRVAAPLGSVREGVGPVRDGQLHAKPHIPDAEYDLVHAGDGARPRARRRADRRARPRDSGFPVAEDRTAHAVRDVDADGHVHRRRNVAAVHWVA